MSTIIDVYESVLSYVNLEHDEETGGIVTRVGDEVHPFMLKNQHDTLVPVVLPTSDQLRSGTQVDKIIFHPLAEDLFVLEESAVMRAFTRVVNIKLNHAIGRVMLGLVTLLSTPEEHQYLTEEQMEILLQIPEVDKGATEALMKVIKDGDKQDPSRVFSYLYLKRKATIADKMYGKGGIITFPFYDGLKQQTGKLKKHTVMFTKVLEFMLPGLGNHDMYSYGSTTDIAPYFNALMMGSKNVTDRLNKIIDIYEPFLSKLYPDLDKLKFTMEWVRYFDNLDNLRVAIKSVPSQVPPKIDKVTVEPMRVEPQRVTPPGGSRGLPQYSAAVTPTPPPAQVTPVNGKVSMDQLLAANPNMVQSQVPPHGYPQGGYPPQGYPQYDTRYDRRPPPPPPPRSYRPEPQWGQQQQPQVMYDQYGRPLMPSPQPVGTTFF